MPFSYYSKSELKKTPSIIAGMDIEVEARYRREGARFIIDMGTTFNFNPSTLATGVVYYHRFYMQHNFQNFPRFPTACACLFLSGKVEETPKKCKDILKFARSILPEAKYNAQFGGDEGKNAYEELMTLERILLQTIKFDLQVEHPYNFLLQYAKCLKGEKSKLEKMVQMSWTFVNDSLCTTLCLQWEPEIIAIALMHLAGKLCKFEVRDWSGRTHEHFRWWDMFVEDMSIELLEDICHQVLDLYGTNQSVSPHLSPPHSSSTSSKPNSPLPPKPPHYEVGFIPLVPTESSLLVPPPPPPDAMPKNFIPPPPPTPPL